MTDRPGPKILVDGTEVGVSDELDLRAGTNVTLTGIIASPGPRQTRVTIDAAGAAGAPSDADYLVGTANGTLTNEIVVGATPGGELGGSWASPTVDATHSGSAHHTQSHDHSAAGDGTTVTPATLNIPFSATPAQTAEGQAVWDSDDDKLTVGDGVGRKTLLNEGATAGGELAGTYPNPTVAATHSGSAHHAQAHSGSDHTDPGTPSQLDIADAASAGTGTNPPAADDHQHAFPAPTTGYPADVAAAEADGTGTTVARADHVHAHGSGYLPNAHHNQSHVLDPGDHTISGKTAGQFLRATAATTFAFEAVPFSVGGLLDGAGAAPANGFRMLWRAPFACTVTNVRGHIDAGTNAVINARRNQTSDHLAVDLTISSIDTWADGGAVQNTAYAAGDDLEIELVSTSGAVTQVNIQVDFTRP